MAVTIASGAEDREQEGAAHILETAHHRLRTLLAPLQYFHNINEWCVDASHDIAEEKKSVNSEVDDNRLNHNYSAFSDNNVRLSVTI
jgi:hypothetical protein